MKRAQRETGVAIQMLESSGAWLIATIDVGASWVVDGRARWKVF